MHVLSHPVKPFNSNRFPLAAHQLLTGAHVSAGAQGKALCASAEPKEAAMHYYE